MRFSNQNFNLQMLNLTEAEPVYVGPSLGIWNGHEFVLRLDSVVGSGAWWARFLDSWVTRVRMLWRYGLSPIWEQQYVTVSVCVCRDALETEGYALREKLEFSPTSVRAGLSLMRNLVSWKS